MVIPHTTHEEELAKNRPLKAGIFLLCIHQNKRIFHQNMWGCVRATRSLHSMRFQESDLHRSRYSSLTSANNLNLNLVTFCSTQSLLTSN